MIMMQTLHRLKKGMISHTRTSSNPSVRHPGLGHFVAVATLAACTEDLPISSPPVAGGSEELPLPGQIIVDPGSSAWLRFENGEPHFLAAAGDPEDFLYRGTLRADGTRDGDQLQIIEKLRGTGVNGIYFQIIRSHGGDGDETHNPFHNHEPDNHLNSLVLDQWDEWFRALEDAGIVIYLFLYDDDATIWETGSEVSIAERAFVESIVNRFEHRKLLVWVIAEEYQEEFTAERVSRLAAIVRAADNHNHPIAVHKLSGLDFEEFADDPNIDQFAIQYNVATAEELHAGMVNAWAAAGGRYNLNMSETRDHGTGAEARRKHWAVAMGGAYVMVLAMDIANTPISDLLDLGRLRYFMESTDFWQMVPADDLGTDSTQYVLAQPGVSYILYSSDTTEGSRLGLRNLSSGEFTLQWFNPVDGRRSVSTSDGGMSSWTVPDGWSGEVAVYVNRSQGSGADGSRVSDPAPRGTETQSAPAKTVDQPPRVENSEISPQQ